MAEWSSVWMARNTVKEEKIVFQIFKMPLLEVLKFSVMLDDPH